MLRIFLIAIAVSSVGLSASRADTYIFRKHLASSTDIGSPIEGTGEDENEADSPPDCGDDPQPGDYCADGSWYAGLSPDGQVPMYVAAADAGSFAFGTGDITQPVHSGSPTDFLGTRFGRENTAYLARNASAFPAIQACVQSTDHGHSDWYLPSKEELTQLMNVAQDSMEDNAGFIPRDHHLSSSVFGSYVQSVGIGASGAQTRSTVSSVRCVRRVGHAPGDPMANDPCPEGMAIAEQCGNGIFYLGRQSDGTRLFADRADLPGVYQFKVSLTDTPGSSFTADGRLNMAGMASEGMENFPAAAACLAKGEEWYLPSMNEISSFKKLTGLSEFPGDGSTQIYWSSTQSSKFGIAVQMDSGAVTSKSVVEDHSVRCVQRR